MDLPQYFPTDWNRRLAGLQDPFRKKFSVVFQDFGRCGHVAVKFSDTDSSQSSGQPVFTAQRQHDKHRDRARLCAQTPTLPLSNTPVKVHYPFHDRVIGDAPQVRARIACFARSLTQVSASLKQNKPRWSRQFMKAKRTLDAVSNPNKLSPFQLDVMEQNLPDSVHQLTHMYTDLSQQPSVQAYNSQYSGGLLSCVSDIGGDNVSHFLFHANGQKLNRLTLTQAHPSNSHLVTSQVLAERKVGRVYQVDSASVYDHIFVAARHRNSCSMFSVPAASQLLHSPGEVCVGNIKTKREIDPTHTNYRRSAPATSVEFTSLGVCDFAGELPTSLSVSPYLPGEGMFCTDKATVYIWSAEQGVQKKLEGRPRFACRDFWLHAYFGSHPRHITLANRTAVQMLDHRDGFRNSIDLFALPNQLVHKKECVMAARHHGDNSPLHMVATSHCVFVVDQRFGGTPVMQWHPDLKGPLQYLASADYLTDSETGSSVVLAASQYPAEVMCYPFSHGSGHTVTMQLNPWRLSRMSDFSDIERYKCFLDDADPPLLHERLGMSLAGVAVARGLREESLVTYQVDCYGEVYFQQYSTPQNPRMACKTGVPASGATDQHMPVDVQGHVRSWLRHLQEQVDSLQTKCGPGNGPGMESYLHRLVRGEGCADPSAARMSERCSFCDADAEALDCDGGGDGHGDFLCMSCHLLQQNFYGGTTESRQGLQPLQSQPGNLEDCTDGRSVGQGLSSLDGIAPPVQSYESDANTSVLLKLMGGESELLEVVKKREEQRSKLLEARKEKVRSARERRWRRRQTTEDDLDLPVTFEESQQQQADHSVFNSAEHQRQNSLINQALAQIQKPGGPVTVSLDPEEEVSSELDSENTPPARKHTDHSSELSFEQSEEEAGVGQSSFMSLSDDDDEFFSSQDMERSLFMGSSGSPLPSLSWSQTKRESLNVSTGSGTLGLRSPQGSLSPSLMESPTPVRKLKPMASPQTTWPGSSSRGTRMVATPHSSPNQPRLRTTPTKMSVASSQQIRTVTVPDSKVTVVTPSRLKRPSPSGLSDRAVVPSPRRDSLPLPHTTSPLSVPHMLKSRSPNVSLMSPPVSTASPHTPSLTSSSEKQRLKSVKKSRRSLLSGFC